METKPTRPVNYLALSIIATILCCLPSGIVSIVYSSKVNSEYNNGNYDGALKASRNAKTWIIVSAIAGSIFYILYFAFFGLAALSAFGEF